MFIKRRFALLKTAWVSFFATVVVTIAVLSGCPIVAYAGDEFKLNITKGESASFGIGEKAGTIRKVEVTNIGNVGGTPKFKVSYLNLESEAWLQITGTGICEGEIVAASGGTCKTTIPVELLQEPKVEEKIRMATLSVTPAAPCPNMSTINFGA